MIFRNSMKKQLLVRAKFSKSGSNVKNSVCILYNQIEPYKNRKSNYFFKEK